VSPNRQPGPPAPRPRIRQSTVAADAVRRLAARRARTSAPHRIAPPGQPAPDVVEEAVAPEVVAVPDDAVGPGGRLALEEAVVLEGTVVPEDTGDLEADDLEADEGDADPDEATNGDRQGRSRAGSRLIVTTVLAVATLVLGGLAAWFGAEASSLNSQPSAQNRALADPGETGQVTSQVTSAINALFSYNYAKPGPTTRAASQLLTGSGVKQYNALFAQVREQAPKEKLIVTTAVSHVGVELLTPTTARVLVFATESDGTTGAGAPSTSGAMLAVNVVLDGGTWKIAGIDTFSG
jgi:Mce-associated membrane protein